MTKQTFFITTPIYYINAEPHIGHAYTTIAADIVASYKRSCGYDVKFLTGTDENSLKTIEAAESCGKELANYTDEMAEKYREVWSKLGIGNDDFVRTTEARHIETVDKVLMRIHESGDFFKDTYEGLYCPGCEAFKNPSDLADGKCPDHNRVPQTLSEENWFFRLSRYADQLKQHIEDHPDFIVPEVRRNEVLGLLKQGLRDISVTRESMDWGLPFAPDRSQIVYVWIDALINYVSTLDYDGENTPRYWPADIQLLAKDILRFHCVIWPAMLMSAGLPLPTTLFVHGFFTIGGGKISKSLGNAVDPVALQEEFGRDALRYYMFAEFPFGKDGDFSRTGLIKRINHDLANDLGNLLNRGLNMVQKYCDGVVPAATEIAAADEQLLGVANGLVAKVEAHFNRMELTDVLSSIWGLVRVANQYVEQIKPWALAKDPSQKARLDTVLYHLLEADRMIATAIRSFMPETSEEIMRQLGYVVDDSRLFTDEMQWGLLAVGGQISKAGVLFPRVEEDAV